MALFNPGWDDQMVTPSSRRIYCTDCGAICPSVSAEEIEGWMKAHARAVHEGYRAAGRPSPFTSIATSSVGSIGSASSQAAPAAT